MQAGAVPASDVAASKEEPCNPACAFACQQLVMAACIAQHRPDTHGLALQASSYSMSLTLT